MSAAGTLFRAVDRATFAAALAARLRTAGMRVTLTTTGRFADGLAIVDPRTRDELYWVARTCLLDDVAQLAVFDRVFAALFDPAASLFDRTASQRPDDPPSAPPSDPPGDRLRPLPRDDARRAGGGGVPWVTPPSATAVADEDGDARLDLAVPRPSALAGRVDVPFAEMDEAELALVGAWIEAAAVRWPHRSARRRHRTSRGDRIDHRRTTRQALRTAGEPVRLVRTRAVTRPRDVVMLADVSGSMRPYVRTHLHLMRALGRVVDAETFAFSTRLTRLTPTLRHRDVRAAVAAATDAVDDRFTGTRIASSIGELLRHPVWSTTVRGAVVVIASDGWDGDPPGDLEVRMRRLRRLAHRIVWVNPRVAAPGFAPLTAGMATAVAHCDALCSGHSVAAVAELLDVLTDR